MRIVLRADASSDIGLGHVSRTLALAHAIQQLGVEVICTGSHMTAGRKLAQSYESIPVVESSFSANEDGAREILMLDPDGVVVDGYHFSADFFRMLDEAAVPYAAIDDGGRTNAIYPRVIHNQNPDASPTVYYAAPKATRLLLGQDYVLLRPEIERVKRDTACIQDVVLLGFGGTDPAKLTIPVAAKLLGAGIAVRMSSSFDSLAWKHLSQNIQNRSVQFFDPSHFPEMLGTSRLAVLGAGSSLWEASAIGVPAIGVIVADNQIGPAHLAQELGYVDYVIDGMPPRALDDACDEILEKTMSVVTQGADSLEDRLRIPVGGALRTAKALIDEFFNHHQDS